MRIVHASQVIEMHEHPAMALREKKDASILVATDLVRRGEADAVVTAGHTGAGMAAAVLRLGRLRGVDRPALAVQMVTAGRPFVLLDIGANPDSTAENLAQYARMGAIFSERVLGVERPRVALLSIGEEKGKGDARIQRATELLDETDLNFIGNVEGKDLTKQVADVVVCDAVLGNVVIKFFEGLSGFIFDLFRAEFRGSLRGRLAYLLLRPGIGRIRSVFDYEVVGGSPLLGVRGAVIITHGRAKRRMIEHAVRVGADDRPRAGAGADRRGARRGRARGCPGHDRAPQSRRRPALMSALPSGPASSARRSGSPRSRCRASCGSAAAGRLARCARRQPGPGPRPGRARPRHRLARRPSAPAASSP